MDVNFFKMHGIGNDYVYWDRVAEPAPDDATVSDLARRIADRHLGVGGDGLVLIVPGERQPLRMRMFNADGSEAEMCGNAIRCVARYAGDQGLVTGNELVVETMKRDVPLQLLADGQVRADMGPPYHLDGSGELTADANINQSLHVDGVEWTYTPVSMGNPHAVVFVDDLDLDLPQIGSGFEHHARFPDRVNTEFVVVAARDELHMRVWERGSGETMACGTGACAVAVAAVVNDRSEREVLIHLRGGDLRIEWSAQNGHVYMTGPAEYVFTGTYRYHQQPGSAATNGVTVEATHAG